ncbi:MAG: prepilin-type N-terminal cleavage/methylation domain-containing protein [bacterium]|nr:prepilin-type N-terminal cleavage/methylation domain-containing protein [bacterium]
MKYKESSLSKGFTLVEILVSLALFGFVVIIATGTLIVLSSSNLSAQVSRKTIDNVDFILDDIVREARLGMNYHCGLTVNNDYESERVPSECNLGNKAFTLTKIDTGDLVRYSTSTVAGKSVLMKQIVQKDTNTILFNSQISGGEIDIKNIKFYVYGSEQGDSEPAYVFITLQAELKKGSRYSTTVDLQTTVVQRALDN